jgi:hypothetical protein
MRKLLFPAVVLLSLLATDPGRAQVDAKQRRAAIDKGITWLVKQQNADGSWGDAKKPESIRLTALAVDVLVKDDQAANGSPHQAKLQAAVDWLRNQCRPDGLIAVPSDGAPTRTDLLHHAAALHALAEMFGEETNKKRRDLMRKTLSDIVRQAAKQQQPGGGWLAPRRPSVDMVEDVALTITLLHAIRTARNVGLPVPAAVPNGAITFLRSQTSKTGGLRGDPRDPADDPAWTAAAVHAGWPENLIPPPPNLPLEWVRTARELLPTNKLTAKEFKLQAHAWFAPTAFDLGSKGWGILFPKDAKDEWLTWARYRERVYGFLIVEQRDNGSWQLAGLGPVEATCLSLSILQVEDRPLPLSR